MEWIRKIAWKLTPGFVKRQILKKAVEDFLESQEGTIQMELLKGFLKSKKAAAFLVGVLALALKELLGLDPATVEVLIELIIGYFVGQGAVDVALALKGKKDA